MLLVVINSIAFLVQLTSWIQLPRHQGCYPETLPSFAQGVGYFCPAVSGKSPRSLGYESSCPWLYFLLVSGTVAHGRGYRPSWPLAISS